MLTSIINFYNENMNLEITIKKLGSVYKFRVGWATGNEHIFLFWPNRVGPSGKQRFLYVLHELWLCDIHSFC